MTNHLSVMNEAIGCEAAGKVKAALSNAGYVIWKGDAVELVRMLETVTARQEALEHAKAFIVAEHLAPAVQKFEIEARNAYREKIIAEIDKLLA